MQWLKKRMFISILTLSVSALIALPQSACAFETSDSLVKIWNEDTESANTKRQQQITDAFQKQKPLIIDSDSPFSGPKNNQATLVVFADYGCIHCKQLAPILENLQKRNPTLKIIHKELPILGMQSTYAAKAALAAQKQNKYLTMNTQLMNSDDLSKNTILKIAAKAGMNMNQFESDLDSNGIEQKIEQNAGLAKNLTIDSVPVMLMINNHHNDSSIFFISGNPQLKTLQALLHKIQN